MHDLKLIVCNQDDDENVSELETKQGCFVSLNLSNNGLVCVAERTSDDADDSSLVISWEGHSWVLLPSRSDTSPAFLNREPIEVPTPLCNGDIISWLHSASVVACYTHREHHESSWQDRVCGDTSICLKAIRHSQDQTAEYRLFQKYFPRLADVARATLHSVRLRTFDEEDVANESLWEFYAGMAAGRFSHLSGHKEYWSLLVCITRRRAIDMLRRAKAQSRNPGLLRGESVFQFNSILDVPRGQTPGSDDVVSESVMVDDDDEVQFFLDFLAACDNEIPLHRIALLRIDGFTNPEIAQRLDLSLRAVERAAARIRNLWRQHSGRHTTESMRSGSTC